MKDKLEFVKLFDSSEFGKIVVMETSSEERIPQVKFYFKPGNLNVCTLSASFAEWETADEYMDVMDLALAEGVVRRFLYEYVSTEMH